MKLILSFLIFAVSVLGQDLMRVDRQLGIRSCSKIASSNSEITFGEDYQIVRTVFDQILSTTGFNGGPQLNYQVHLINSPVVNAFAAGGGQMIVLSGLMKAVHSNPGLLAMVMAHEMVHNRNQHLAKKVIRLMTIDYEVQKLRQEDHGLGALAYEVAANIAEKKAERNDEDEADQVGMLLAAQAGYHPDYAILEARLMRAESGDQSKFAAFFSDHPRWTTREEHFERNYDIAREAFEHRWNAVQDSPGGTPPAIASLAKTQTDKTGRTATVETTVRIRNLQGQTAIMRFELCDKSGQNPIVLGTKQFDQDQDSREPLRFEVSKEAIKAYKNQHYLHIAVETPSAQLYSSALIALK